MKKVIAERKLLYSPKGGNDLKEMLVCISEPYFIEEGMDQHNPVLIGAAVCSISYEGIEFKYPDIHGMDRMQALTLALKIIDSNFEMLRNEYDFYFLNGDPYIEDDEGKD